MVRQIAFVKFSVFGVMWMYSLLPLVAPAIYVSLAPFASVVVGLYVLVVITSFWLLYHQHQTDYSLLLSGGIFAMATILAFIWPTALGYAGYFILTSFAYFIPALAGLRTIAKN
ncbi:MAG: hypothetical protein ACRCWD_00350 [Culicoidibacterales bacterium]